MLQIMNNEGLEFGKNGNYANFKGRGKGHCDAGKEAAYFIYSKAEMRYAERESRSYINSIKILNGKNRSIWVLFEKRPLT